MLLNKANKDVTITTKNKVKHIESFTQLDISRTQATVYENQSMASFVRKHRRNPVHSRWSTARKRRTITATSSAGTKSTHSTAAAAKPNTPKPGTHNMLAGSDKICYLVGEGYIYRLMQSLQTLHRTVAVCWHVQLIHIPAHSHTHEYIVSTNNSTQWNGLKCNRSLR